MNNGAAERWSFGRRIVFALTRREDLTKHYTLTYAQPEPERIIVSGAIEGQNVRAVLRRIHEPELLLVNRGFRWINQYPCNR